MQFAYLAIGLLLVLGVIVALKHVAGVLNNPPERAVSADLPYRKKDYLLSKAERSFYGVLRQAVSGHWQVCAKVRVLDLVWLPKGTDSPQKWRNKVMSKHVDFVLCDAEALGPVLVIELDDASHTQRDRQARDEFVDQVFKAAKLPILHVPAQLTYDTAALARQIQTAARAGGVASTN